MKVTKSQIKELIRHAIVELTEKTFGSQAQYDAYRKKHNLKPGSKHKVAGKTVTVRDTKKMSKKVKSLGDKMADKLNKRMADLEKKRKQGKIKEGASSKTIAKFKKVIDRESTMDVEDMIMNYDYDKKYSREIGGLLDDMRDEEQGIKPSGYAKSSKKKLLKVLKKAINESKKRRFTVKEVRMWMKKLEENRYKKVYNSDARRVAWMVNNEGRTLDEMPISMKKKWTKAQYGRERYLATEFLKSKSEQMTESVIKEAITGADRKILFILIREIVRNLKSKIKNFDVNNKSHLNRVGSSILAIIRAMSYSPDNVNYKNFKKYFPKNFNSKLIQKKLKQFHSQNDKVQVTLVTQAIKNELGAGVNESKLRGMIREIIKEQLNEAPKPIHHSDAKAIQVPKKDIKKAQKLLLKKYKPKGGSVQVEFDTKPVRVPGHIKVTTTKKIYNDVIELLMKNNINTRG